MKNKINSKDLKRLAITLCHAQTHCGDPEAWGKPSENIGRREEMFQCLSFAVACFLSDLLEDGVEWEIVLQELVLPPLKNNGMYYYNTSEWEKIIVDKYHGFN